MNINEKFEILKNITLENSDKEFVVYVDQGFVEADDQSYTITDLPPFFRVRIHSHPGKRSDIRTEIWLPLDWNGRFVGIGNGGIGGVLHLRKFKEYIQKGYACAHTDLGTSSGIACGYQNQDVKLDYGGRATHLMTVHAKTLISALCGRMPEYSYFCGSSTGGLQAYTEAQRYPEDYDGIYAGVPSIINTSYHTYYMWNYLHLHTSDGKPIFVHEDYLRLSNASAAYFQKLGDGCPGDSFVTTPYRGINTVPDFMEFLNTELPDLTEVQLSALRDIYNGPCNPVTGKQICCGLPIGGERTMESFAGEKCPGIYVFYWAFGPDFNPYTFNFSSDFDYFFTEMSQYINSVDPDLSKFRACGGKLLAYSGTADTVVPYPETDIYYERAAQKAGGYDKLSEFFRYYLLPGRSHTAGVGADRFCSADNPPKGAFSSLVRWCEEGIAPDTMKAVSSDNPDVIGKKPFARIIFPYGSKEFPFGEHPKSFSN